MQTHSKIALSIIACVVEGLPENVLLGRKYFWSMPIWLFRICLLFRAKTVAETTKYHRPYQHIPSNSLLSYHTLICITHTFFVFLASAWLIILLYLSYLLSYNFFGNNCSKPILFLKKDPTSHHSSILRIWVISSFVPCVPHCFSIHPPPF